jgi:hypothetical protein
MSVEITSIDDTPFLKPDISLLPGSIGRYFSADEVRELAAEERFDAYHRNLFIALCAAYDQAFPIVGREVENGQIYYRGPIYESYLNKRNDLIHDKWPRKVVDGWREADKFPLAKLSKPLAKSTLYENAKEIYPNILNQQIYDSFLLGIKETAEDYFKILREHNVLPGSNMWNYICTLFVGRAARSNATSPVRNQLVGFKDGSRIQISTMERNIETLITRSLPYWHCAIEISRNLRKIEPGLFETNKADQLLHISTMWSTLSYLIMKIDKEAQKVLVKDLISKDYDHAKLIFQGLYDENGSLFKDFVVKRLGLQKRSEEELPF